MEARLAELKKPIGAPATKTTNDTPQEKKTAKQIKQDDAAFEAEIKERLAGLGVTEKPLVQNPEETPTGSPSEEDDDALIERLERELAEDELHSNPEPSNEELIEEAEASIRDREADDLLANLPDQTAMDEEIEKELAGMSDEEVDEELMNDPNIAPILSETKETDFENQDVAKEHTTPAFNGEQVAPERRNENPEPNENKAGEGSPNNPPPFQASERVQNSPNATTAPQVTKPSTPAPSSTNEKSSGLMGWLQNIAQAIVNIIRALGKSLNPTASEPEINHTSSNEKPEVAKSTESKPSPDVEIEKVPPKPKPAGDFREIHINSVSNQKKEKCLKASMSSINTTILNFRDLCESYKDKLGTLRAKHNQPEPARAQTPESRSGPGL